jgi:hypothetical protein
VRERWQLGELVEAGQVLDDAVFEKGRPPEAAARAIDQVQGVGLVHQKVAPLEVAMHEAALVHAARNVGQLARNAVQPAPTFQARVAVAGKPAEVGGVGDLRRDQRAALETAALALQAVADQVCRGDAPVGEMSKVLPLQLHARRGQPAAQGFLAEAGIALDVVTTTVDLDAQRARHRVHGDDLAVEGEDAVEVGEARRRYRVDIGHQPPVGGLAHAPAPGAYLRW